MMGDDLARTRAAPRPVGHRVALDLGHRGATGAAWRRRSACLRLACAHEPHRPASHAAPVCCRSPMAAIPDAQEPGDGDDRGGRRAGRNLPVDDARAKRGGAPGRGRQAAHRRGDCRRAALPAAGCRPHAHRHRASGAGQAGDQCAQISTHAPTHAPAHAPASGQSARARRTSRTGRTGRRSLTGRVGGGRGGACCRGGGSTRAAGRPAVAAGGRRRPDPRAAGFRERAAHGRAVAGAGAGARPCLAVPRPAPERPGPPPGRPAGDAGADQQDRQERAGLPPHLLRRLHRLALPRGADRGGGQ